MTASELFYLIKELPAEAVCGTIRLGSHRWFDLDGNAIDDAHAEALQRDAMTEWLETIDDTHPYLTIRAGREVAGDKLAVVWCVYLLEDHEDQFVGSYPTRTHALAAACRYVAGQAASSPSSS